jgi:hypothetical protein
LRQANAAGAEVPAQYRGQWCFTANAKQLYRCREANSEGAPYIARYHLYLGEPDSVDADCRVISVRPTAKGHRVGVDCGTHPTGDKPVKDVVNLWLNARGRLVVRGSRASAAQAELPDKMVGTWCYAKEISTDAERHYLEPYGEDGCENNPKSDEDGPDRSIVVEKNRYYVSHWVAPRYRHFCEFEKIEMINATTYLVHASCQSGWGRDPQTGEYIKPPWTENLKLQVIGGELVITERRFQ